MEKKKKSPPLHLKLSVIAVKRLQAESRENIGVQITKGSQIKTTTNNWMKPLEGIDHSSTKKKMFTVQLLRHLYQTTASEVCNSCQCVCVCVYVSLTVHISVLRLG